MSVILQRTNKVLFHILYSLEVMMHSALLTKDLSTQDSNPGQSRFHSAILIVLVNGDLEHP